MLRLLGGGAQRVDELLDVLVGDRQRRQHLQHGHLVPGDLREDAVVGEERHDDELREQAGLRTLEECQKVAKALPGWKMFGDIAVVNGKPFVELADIAALGFNLVTMHYLEKGSMWGMMDFGRRVFAENSTRYADEHTMGGLTPAQQKQQLERDIGWMDAEEEWKRL